MKCPKSRNSKNVRSSSRSLGTVPGWRSASSETIRGDAEPDVVDVQLGLGQVGDEVSDAHAAQCVTAARR